MGEIPLDRGAGGTRETSCYKNVLKVLVNVLNSTVGKVILMGYRGLES